VLQAAGRFCEEVLEPLNRSGDEEGCRFAEGRVETPTGFRAAYKLTRESGWTNIREGDDDGALTTAAAFCVDEMLGAANLAFSNYLGPTRRVVQALSCQSDSTLAQSYLEPLLSGAYAGTLCLTEPQCGTDLGLIRTRAEPGASGDEYLLSGTKIFVTSGEHDLADNIVHLVLARIDGSPGGAKGLSLFLVPKIIVDPLGAAPECNGVRCVGIEHKMGLRASATCTLVFSRARGALIGGAGEGLRTLFPVMERERLLIALQSVGLAEHSTQKAVAYARERLQGRAATGAKFPQLPADPIIVHADVRRMLLTMRAYTEGSRALSSWVACQLDRARSAPDAESRRDALDFVRLLTPVMKAFVSDLAVETTNLGIQVFGGHGYIRESAVEQLAREARITQLYAGANGIQALDLIVRKLPARDGRMLELFTGPARLALESWERRAGAQHFTGPVRSALETLEAATRTLLTESSRDPDLAGAVGSAYVHLFGHVALAFVWAHAALTSMRREERADGATDKTFYAAKVVTADFYLQHLLPRIDGHFRSLAAGSSSVMRLDADGF
jgi:butyryl-CoA dehydrogenase